MISALETLRLNRRVCTGLEAPWSDEPDLRPDCLTDGEFKQLVSGYYCFFCEDLARDVSYLMLHVPRESRGVVTRFNERLTQLRTTHQHAVSSETRRSALDWTASNGPMPGPGHALGRMLEGALDVLADVSSAVRRDPQLAAQWAVVAGRDSLALVQSIASDLGLVFAANQLRAKAREVDARLRVLALEDFGHLEEWAEDAAVQTLLAREQGVHLPVSYGELLDATGTVGSLAAAPVLRLAYGLAGLSDATGDEFIALVDSIYAGLRPPKEDGGGGPSVRC